MTPGIPTNIAANQNRLVFVSSALDTYRTTVSPSPICLLQEDGSGDGEPLSWRNIAISLTTVVSENADYNPYRAKTEILDVAFCCRVQDGMPIIVSVLFVVSVVLLLYIKTVGSETVLPQLHKLGVPAAKYVAATFISTYGSLGIGAVIAVPLLLYQRLAHTQSGAALFSTLLDRPYFPLQMAVASVLGYSVSERLKEGRPAYAWVWPVAQVTIAVLLFHPSAMQSFAAGVWRTYFDWGCGCSVTLRQWTITAPLYPSVAFSVAAFLRRTKVFSRRVTPAVSH